MPALAPAIDKPLAAKLLAIGETIRARRRSLRISATDAAEAAGMSRVTLHRIERGAPSVAMAAYMSALAALGLEFEVVDPRVARVRDGKPVQVEQPPPAIRLTEYPQLARLAWHLRGVQIVTPEEALGLYERHWRHIDADAMDPAERKLVQSLGSALAGGRLLVRA